jgi:hypothetical protein
MRQGNGIQALAAVNTSLSGRRAACQDVYDAFDFGIRVESGPGNGYFFAMHDDRPVMARKLVAFPGDGPARPGFFCVEFHEGTTAVKDAFAYHGPRSERVFFGRLPVEFGVTPPTTSRHLV